MKEARVVLESECRDFAEKHSMEYIEISNSEDIQVQDLIHKIAKMLFDKQNPVLTSSTTTRT